MIILVVGGVLKKDNKYLLVQEAKEKCRGKWNLPAGRLNPGETVFEGAKREIFEECGYNVEITGLAFIGNRIMDDNTLFTITFSTEIIDGNINFDSNEIMDVKWFTYDEIVNMHDELRTPDGIIAAITAVEKNNTSDANLIRILK